MGKRARRVTLLLVLLVLLTVVLGPNLWIWHLSHGRIRTLGSPDDTSTAPVAVVLGASVYADGTPSTVLRRRLDTAVRLYASGRVEAVLVSGDNSEMTYNEPVAMRAYLIEQGVPPEAIALDYAGLDTYDTCVRAHRIFGVDQAIMVTQDFHAPRAVAVCRAVGVDAHGVVDAETVSGTRSWWRSWLRERVAAMKAAWDVVSDRQPILGDREVTVDEARAWTRSQRPSVS